MPAKPVRHLLLAEFARGKRKENYDQFGVLRRQDVSVPDKEKFADHRRRTLVSVHERMIARDPERIGGGQRRGVGLAIGSQIFRSRQRALKCSGVARSLAAAMLRQLGGMCGRGNASIDPDPNRHGDMFYLASSRSAR